VVTGQACLVFRSDLHDLGGMTHALNGPRLRIRIQFGAAEMIGPGKAELLERIDRTGSIAAAGREMCMSYKRAWELIGTLNAMFHAPLVISSRGGQGGGGAVLTDTGRSVLQHYRSFEAETARAGAADLEALTALLRPDTAGS
jgi:molybdate transport system regulatory protein